LLDVKAFSQTRQSDHTRTRKIHKAINSQKIEGLKKLFIQLNTSQLK